MDGDGTPDTLTTVTDDNGAYLFDNLPAGDYTITVDPATLPAGMNQTADPDGVNDNTSEVTLAADEDNLDQDFGYQGTGSIGDTIWDDDNGDGIQNGGEGGLQNVDVTLSVDFDGDGTVDYTQTTTTNGSGNYLFDNLPEGDYTIAVDTGAVPDAYVLTGDPDTNLDSTSTVNLPAGGTNLDQDFGYQNSGSPQAPSATPSILMQTITQSRMAMMPVCRALASPWLVILMVTVRLTPSRQLLTATAPICLITCRKGITRSLLIRRPCLQG